MKPNMPQDELLQRYEQAKAQLPDGLPNTPSAALRERIMQAAREQANATKIVAPRTDSMPATGLKGIEGSAHTGIMPAEASNDSFWNIRALGSIAVMGLAGLLWWQFEHGTPEEQLAAKSAKPSAPISTEVVAPAPSPSPAPAAAPAAPSVLPAAPTATPTPAPTPTANSEHASTIAVGAASGTAPEATASRKDKDSQTKKTSDSKAASAEVATPNAPAPAALPIPAAAAAKLQDRTRMEETTQATTPAPAQAPAVQKYSQTDKAIAADIPSNRPSAAAAQPAAQRSLETAPAPAPAPNMAAAKEPSAAAARAAPPPVPSAVAPIAPAVVPRAAAPAAAPAPSPAPAAPPPSVFSRANFLAALDARDALTLREKLAQGISPNVIAADGNPALHRAVIMRWPEGVRILLAAGANRSSKNSKGHTAADVALELGYEDMSRLLEAPL